MRVSKVFSPPTLLKEANATGRKTHNKKEKNVINDTGQGTQGSLKNVIGLYFYGLETLKIQRKPVDLRVLLLLHPEDGDCGVFLMYPVEIKSLYIFQTTSSAWIIYDIVFSFSPFSLFIELIKQLDKADQNKILILRHHQPQVCYKQKV